MLSNTQLLRLTNTDMINPYLFIGLFNNRATVLDPSQESVEVEIKRVKTALSLFTTDNKFKQCLETRLENLQGYENQ